MEIVTSMAKLKVEMTAPGGPLADLVEEAYNEGLQIQQSALEAAAERIVALLQENTPDVLLVGDDSEFAIVHSSVCRSHQGPPCPVVTAITDGVVRAGKGAYFVWMVRPDREDTQFRVVPVE